MENKQNSNFDELEENSSYEKLVAEMGENGEIEIEEMEEIGEISIEKLELENNSSEEDNNSSDELESENITFAIYGEEKKHIYFKRRLR